MQPRRPFIDSFPTPKRRRTGKIGNKLCRHCYRIVGGRGISNHEATCEKNPKNIDPLARFAIQ